MKRRILQNKRKEFSSSSVSSYLVPTNNSSALNRTNAILTEENSFRNADTNRLDAISSISSVNSVDSRSNSNSKLTSRERSSSLYSKRKCEEMYQALDEIRK